MNEIQAPDDIGERVCVVTGASAGIGKAIAHGLAALGAQVLLVSRDEARGVAALNEIRQATGNPHVSLLLADLASMMQVRRLAEEIVQRSPSVHVLINNAAIIPPQRQLTDEGLEMQLAVNHLAPFLLTNLLLDHLLASKPARVINISSQTHAGAAIPFDDIQSERDYQPSAVYAWTKLANILFTYELARRLPDKEVTINAVHPGVINTRLLHNYMGAPDERGRQLSRFGSSPEKGAETPIFLAVSAEVQDTTGGYFRDRRPLPSSPASYDGVVARRLWDVSAQLVSLY